jgi:hypothetical protein
MIIFFFILFHPPKLFTQRGKSEVGAKADIHWYKCGYCTSFSGHTFGYFFIPALGGASYAAYFHIPAASGV